MSMPPRSSPDRDLLRRAVDEQREIQLALDLSAPSTYRRRTTSSPPVLLGHEPMPIISSRSARLLGGLHDLDSRRPCRPARVHLNLHDHRAADVARRLLASAGAVPVGRAVNLDPVLAPARPSPDTRRKFIARDLELAAAGR